MYKYLYFILLALFGSGNFVLAGTTSLKITEVMYDFPGTDDGHEYIKIENTGADPVDITGYKFMDGASATKHAINLPPKNGGVGAPVIEPQSFLILADDAVTYLADNPEFSGSVLDSTFSLNNDGGTVELLDQGGLVVASYTYPVEVVVDPETEDEDDQPEPIELILNEIMYDLPGTDDGREWIEVYNVGAGDVDLSGLKLFEAETNHGIVSVGSPFVPAGGFAVIIGNSEKFLADWPDFTGLVFDSTFSLSNTGEELALKDADGNIVDQVSYSSDMGATGNERSLQKNEDNFIEALPTPGEANKSAAEPLPPAEEDDSSDDSSLGGSSSGGSGSSAGSSSSSPKTSTPKVLAPKTQKLTLKIDSPVYAIVNSGFNISASGGPGRYVWNFGNGEVIEAVNSESFSYNYQFPGSYMITLNYFQDEKSKPIKVSAKIKVEENPINISEILPDGSVEIHNESTHQIDMSGWVLKSGLANFTLPPETLLLAGSSVIIPVKVTKFYPGASYVELLYPSGISAYSFNKSLPVTPHLKASQDAKPPSEEKKKEISVESEVLDVELSASVINSLPAQTGREDEQPRPLFPWMLGLGGIIFISSVASFFLFSGSKLNSSGFKILD